MSARARAFTSACRFSSDRFQAVVPAGHPSRRAARPSESAGIFAASPWIGGAPSSGWYRIVRHACQTGRLHVREPITPRMTTSPSRPWRRPAWVCRSFRDWR